MKVAILFLICVSPPLITAQTTFHLTDAYKLMDVDISIGQCNEFGDICGPVSVAIFRKNTKQPIQTIRLARTQIWDTPPKVNVINRYDDQSIINFGDYNFDGIDDLAICDGADGGYGMPS